MEMLRTSPRMFCVVAKPGKAQRENDQKQTR